MKRMILMVSSNRWYCTFTTIFSSLLNALDVYLPTCLVNKTHLLFVIMYLFGELPFVIMVLLHENQIM